MELKLTPVGYTAPTDVENKKWEARYRRFTADIEHYCFFCKKVTVFRRCMDCDKRFCLNHCDEETLSYEEGGGSFPLCYHKRCC